MAKERIEVTGRLGQKPELRSTNNGKQVSSFSVAVKSKRNGEDHTNWYDVSVWEKQAELAVRLLDKGDLVCVDGTPSVKSFTTRNGETKTSIQITARTFDLLAKGKAASEAFKKSEPASDDFSEIPF
jgi:single-strand DNA-binding protein